MGHEGLMGRAALLATGDPEAVFSLGWAVSQGRLKLAEMVWQHVFYD